MLSVRAIGTVSKVRILFITMNVRKNKQTILYALGLPFQTLNYLLLLLESFSSISNQLLVLRRFLFLRLLQFVRRATSLLLFFFFPPAVSQPAGFLSLSLELLLVQKDPLELPACSNEQQGSSRLITQESPPGIFCTPSKSTHTCTLKSERTHIRLHIVRKQSPMSLQSSHFFLE